MKFIFVRHGQATHNSDAKRRGSIAYLDPIHTDAFLDDVGAKQVDSERDIVCDAIYCSPLRRCRISLQGIMPAAADRLVRLDDRLMETQGSAYCNKRSDLTEIITSCPLNWDLSGVSTVNPFDVVKEHYSKVINEMPEFNARVRSMMDDILARHTNDETILIVGHHDWIRSWFNIYKGDTLSPIYGGMLVADYEKI
jgi:broad specificity phosphatase PhoE